jgi:TP901 family phage tail tape measure protein
MKKRNSFSINILGDASGAMKALGSTQRAANRLDADLRRQTGAAKVEQRFAATVNTLRTTQKELGNTKARLADLRREQKETGDSTGRLAEQIKYYTRQQRSMQASQRSGARSLGRMKVELGGTTQGLYRLIGAEDGLQRRLERRQRLVERLEVRQRRAAALGDAMKGLPLMMGLSGNPAMGTGMFLGRAATGTAAGAALGGAAGLGFGAAASATAAVLAKAEEARQVDTTLRLMQNTGGFSDAEREAIKRRTSDLSLETLTGQQELLQAMQDLIAAGLKKDEALGMLAPLAKTAKGSGAEMGDMAKLVQSLQQNFGVNEGSLTKALDMLSTSGKQGSFELKDMAREFANIGPQMKALGLNKVSDLSSVSSMLQVAKMGAATTEEAANNLKNFLAKVQDSRTMDNLEEIFKLNTGKKLDVMDLLGNPKKYFPEAKNALEAYMLQLRQLTDDGRDYKTMGKIFGDMQVKNFLRPMNQNWSEYQRIAEVASKNVEGTIINDFNNVVAGQGAGLKELEQQWNRFALNVNDALNPVVDTMAGLTAKSLGFASSQLGFLLNMGKVGLDAFSSDRANKIRAFESGKTIKSTTPTPLKRALGGDAPKNTLIKVGEEGPEHLVLPSAGRVIPHRTTAPTGGGVVLNINVQTLPSQSQLTHFIGMAKSRSGQLYDAPSLF